MNKKTIKRTALIFVVLSMMAIMAGCGAKKAEAYRTVAVSDFNGSVVVSKSGAEAQDVYKDQHLVAEDVATVGNASGMSLIVDDDKALTVAENSKISIDATGDKTKGKVSVNLIYGMVNVAISNKLEENDSFEVETTNAIMAVRGTEFTVNYDTEKNITSVLVQNGTVEVTVKSTNEKCLVNEGESIVVKEDKIEEGSDADNSDPATYSPLKSSKWGEEIIDIVIEKKNGTVREIDIASVEDYEKFVNSENTNDAILYFESKTYDFTNTEFGTMQISKMKNVTFVGTGDTKIISTSGWDEILVGYESEDLTFYGMSFGHDLPSEGGCTAGVISISEMTNISFIGCDIYGCGIIGGDFYLSTINFKGSVIRDCSEAAFFIGDGEVYMNDCVISGNDYMEFDESALIGAYGSIGKTVKLTIENSIIRNNLCNIYIASENAEIVENNNTYLGNKFDK